MISKERLINGLKKGLNNPMIINLMIVGIVTILVKGLGFAKEIVIANEFGLSELIDTFYIAILIPNFISSVFLSSFRSVFIPNYVYELKAGKPIGAFQSTCFLITFAVSLFFCIIAYLGTDVYLETFFKGHTESYYALVKTQFHIVIPAIFFWGLSSLITGLLTIDDEFVFSSLGSVFTPLAMMVCLFFFNNQLGTTVLAVGTLIGSGLNFIFVLTVALRRHIIHIDKPDFTSNNMIRLFLQLPTKIGASILSGVNEIVDQYFAASLVIGSIAALNYGIKIPMFAVGIATMALGSVLLPYFSKKVAENREKAFSELKRILKVIIISSTAVAVILVFISAPIISLIFERNAFTEADTVVVSRIQQMYLLQIPAYIATLLMVRFLDSINKTKFMFYAAIMSLALNIALNYILINSMGVYGLALATSIVTIINGLALYLYIEHLNKGNE